MSDKEPAALAPAATEFDELEPEDARLARVLNDCMAALEAGDPVDLEALLRDNASLAPRIQACLAGMQLIEDQGHVLAAAVHKSADDVGDKPAPQLLGDFRILREVGRGAMGVVYEAVQTSLGRRVALKVLPFAATLDARQMQRFTNEAQAAALLHHTNIVPVYQVGCERGVHFYAMQYIEGHNLEMVLRELRQDERRIGSVSDRSRHGATTTPVADAPGSPSETLALVASTVRSSSGPEHFRMVARLGLQAAEALEHAHERGVIHRDVKPANLLVDHVCHLWVADFGLAQVRGDPRLTQTGAIVGTLRYISPEQALGKRGHVDHRTDVYALGASLYELLTLRPLFDGDDAQELLRQIALDEPAPLRRVRPAIPVELEVIVLKAVAKERGERYATAQALADDLRRYLEDRPIQARPPSLREKLTKWARRHRGLVRAAVCLLVVALAGLTVATTLIYLAKSETEAALEREIKASAALALALDQQKKASYRHSIALANQEWWNGRAALAARLLDDCPAELRDWEWFYLKRLTQTVRPLLGGQLLLAVAPDGKRLATVDSDRVACIRDAVTCRELTRLAGYDASGNDASAGQTMLALTFSSEGAAGAGPPGEGPPGDGPPGTPRRLLVALVVAGNRAFQATVLIWDANTGQHLHALRPDPKEHVHNVTFSPDGTLVAGVGRHRVYVWDTASGRLVHEFKGKYVHCVEFSADGKRLYCADDKTIKVWDAVSGAPVREHAGPPSMIGGCGAFSPDCRWLAFPAFDNSIRLWDIAAEHEVRSYHGHSNSVNQLSFGNQGRFLASASSDQSARVWDVATGEELRAYRGHGTSVHRAALTQSGMRLFTLTVSQELRSWDMEDRQYIKRLVHNGTVARVDFSPDGRFLAVCGTSGHIRVWDAPAGKLLRTLAGHRGTVMALAYSQDGTRLASTGTDGTVRLWDPNTDQQLAQFERSGTDGAVAFSADGKRLAWSMTSSVAVVDLTTKLPLGSIPLPDGNFRRVIFSANGERFTVLGIKAPLTVWDVPNLRVAGVLPARSAAAIVVNFSRDGRLLAVQCRNPNPDADSDIVIWDTVTGQETLTLPDTVRLGITMALSADNRRLATAESEARIVRLWDAQTGHELVKLRGVDRGFFRSLTFSADGRFLAAAVIDAVILWNASTLDKDRPAAALADH